MSNLIPVALFLRVSSDRQDATRQKNDLLEEAGRRGWEVVKTVSEVISGSADYDDRDGLDEVLDLARRRKIRKVMAHEVTRLGRRPSVILPFVEELTKAKVSLYLHLQSIETLNQDGTPNMYAELMISILSGLAKNETDLLKARILSGQAEARRKGVHIGRPKGKWDEARTREEHRDNLVKLGENMHLSVRDQGRLLNLAPGTVMRLRKLLPVP